MAKIQNVHIPAELKNNAKNGALDFWQERGASVVTVNTATAQSAYSADMLAFTSTGATVKNYSLQRSTDVPSIAQSGFQSTYSSLFTMITGIVSPAAGDVVAPHVYRMEGLDYLSLHTSPVSIGFWFKTSVAGTYSVAVRNAAADRSYVTTFTAAANTWEFKSISLTLDSAGTWLFTNALALTLDFCTYAGTTFQTSNLNQWQSGNFLTATGSTNYLATAAATIRIAQISIVKGPLGFSQVGFQRQGKDIGQEFAFCLRYYELMAGSLFGSNSAGNNYSTWWYKVQKRVTPTVTASAISSVSDTNDMRIMVVQNGNFAQIVNGIADARL